MQWLVKSILDWGKITATIVGFAVALTIQIIAYYHNPEKFLISDAIESIPVHIALVIAALSYFRPTLVKSLATRTMGKPYFLIVGLSDRMQALLLNEIESAKNETLNSVVVDDKNPEKFHDTLINEGIGVINSNIFNASMFNENKLDFANLEKVVISLGDDQLNIEAATRFIKEYQEANDGDTSLRIIVEIEKRGLEELFYQSLEQHNTQSKKLEVQTFSFFEACIDDLFAKFGIESSDNRVIRSDRPYEMVVIGEGKLVHELVYQLAKLAHFPNKNPLKLNLVGESAEFERQRILKKYSGIESVIELRAINLKADSADFYQSDLWANASLTRVFICYEEQDKNIDIAMDLFNLTYYRSAIQQTMTVEVFFAVFNSHSLWMDFDQNSENLKNFHVFGDEKQICTKKCLLDDESNLISKLVHFDYGDEYKPDEAYKLDDEKLRQIDAKWFDESTLSDRESSKAQAKHIRVKLKSMGLEMVPSEMGLEGLLKANLETIDSVLMNDRRALEIDDESLYQYSLELKKVWDGEDFKVQYFPTSYTTLFEKLIRCEHERWNAYHYLNGWKYSEVKDKPIRLHDCLKPLKEFTDPKHQITVIYDIYSILYIPKYLAMAGYRIQKI